MIYVKSIPYIFEDLSVGQNSKYIFQHITERKLTNIYHTHNFFEICVLLQGNATELYNEKTRVINAGTVTVLKPGDRHSFLSQSEKIDLICLSVEKDEALRLCDDFNINFPKEEISFQAANIGVKINNLLNFSNTEQQYKLLFCFILFLYTQKEKQNIPSNIQFALQQMHVYSNLQLGVPKFVELSGYSRSQLSRIIQRHYSLSLQKLILDLRLEAAYREITLSKENLEDISEKVGYNSFSHFNKIFKEKYGITPAVLRKENKIWTV